MPSRFCPLSPGRGGLAGRDEGWGEGGKSTQPWLDPTGDLGSNSAMAWIELIRPEEASGLLRRLYAAAVKRAGKVFQVIQVQSRRPDTLRASTQLYMEIMASPKSPLARYQREMIATVVSRTNGCHY